ncbi:MAG: glycerophosphoryl diester phosphodiesterase membrane domain-containing protein [Rhodoglobus sp.]
MRPLTLGTLLGASFQVLRRNPRPTFGFALLVSGLVTIFTVVVVGLVTFFAVSRTLTATNADAATLSAGSVAMIILSGLVPVVLSIVASAVLQGVISLEVARGTLGEKLRLGGLWRAARGRIGALIGWSLLVTAAVLVALAIVAVVIALIVAVGGTAGIVIGVLLGLLFGAAAVVSAVWLGTRLSLVPSVLMLERLPLRDALRRSWSLTVGYFWRTFGIELLVIFIVQTVASIISAPLSLLLGIGSALINPNGDQGGVIVGVIVVYGLTLVVSLVFGAIASVVQAATPALIYIDLRMRREGLDLELNRFVEARQAGDTSVANPYLPRLDGNQPQPASAPWS